MSEMFGAKSHFDSATAKPRKLVAKSRVGGNVARIQGSLVGLKHKCPWQVYKDPETGKTRLERTYLPEEEPLSEIKLVEENLNG